MSSPKTDPKTHRKNVALTMDPHVLRSAKAICKLNGWALSRVVEMLLKDWMKNRLRVTHEGVTQIVIPSANDQKTSNDIPAGEGLAFRHKQ